MENKEENPRLAFVQQMIGRDLTEGPSPFARWLSGKLTAADEGTVSVAFEVRKEMTNPMDTLHGGVIAAMFDEVMGITVYILNMPGLFPTLNLHVDYFYPAKVGDVVTVVTRAKRQGKTFIHIEAELYNQTQKLLAKCGANFITAGTKSQVSDLNLNVS